MFLLSAQHWTRFPFDSYWVLPSFSFCWYGRPISMRLRRKGASRGYRVLPGFLGSRIEFVFVGPGKGAEGQTRWSPRSTGFLLFFCLPSFFGFFFTSACDLKFWCRLPVSWWSRYRVLLPSFGAGGGGGAAAGWAESPSEGAAFAFVGDVTRRTAIGRRPVTSGDGVSLSLVERGGVGVASRPRTSAPRKDWATGVVEHIR